MKNEYGLLRASLIFILLGVLLLCPVFCHGEEPALRNSLWTVNMTGLSMGKGAPDKALVVPIRYENLHIGMWVLRARWDRAGRVSYVAHRIVGRNGHLWILQGDNMQTNGTPDRIPLSPSNYGGVVCSPTTIQPL